MVYVKTLFIVKIFSSMEVVSFRGSYFSRFTESIIPYNRDVFIWGVEGGYPVLTWEGG
jgi:hypothetical protein